MPARKIVTPPAWIDFQAIRDELIVPARYPADAVREATSIADVSTFVTPGGAVADETWRRGETLYSPDINTPLHPVELSEGAASLLPVGAHPAVLWTIRLDARGEPVDVDVRSQIT